MDLRHAARAALAAALIPLLACGSTAASAARPRIARSAPDQEWARGAVFYEVFVRSFSDSNGDGIGDLRGLINKLDYLNDGNPATSSDLGVDALWLMPVFESPSYHGYDATDYETIERDYGTNADFQRLLAEAHKRGIRVIVDFVMNHTSSEHPWFIESASSPAAPKRNWYVWSAADPGWHQAWGGNYPTWYLKNGAYYYGLFWSGMPDLNYRTPAVKAEMFRLARLWLARGVDGYRLDATRYLLEDGAGAGQADTPATHRLLRELSDEVRAARPDAVLIAENTVDTRTLATYVTDRLMNFDFPLATAVVDGVKSGDPTTIHDALRDIIRLYPPGTIDAPFLTNHDHTRVATVLGNDPGKLRNAAAILLTLPGAPFLYYGEEVGLQNGPSETDEAKRTPMPWTGTAGTGGFTSGRPWEGFSPGLAVNNVAAETGDPDSLLSTYRNWIAARKRSQALSKGDLALVETKAPLLAFIRAAGDERVLVVHNVSATAIDASPLAVHASRFEPIYADRGVGVPSIASGTAYVSLPPHGSGAWRIR